ncbi:terminase large subunit domain-containing protein [Methanothrix soehngenii]|uniref:terminase large subunit domain-containing protein n=1 Tax=Methanothrix soehngenii TaxID=2223 RepID=UPI002B8D72C5|nr:terminase family protein [Methanothrix soehngenii]HOS21416.1 terminase family protein [Methanothrix soehngenii]HPL19755.1 terminase family protein [Methanothrix soehngenii]
MPSASDDLAYSLDPVLWAREVLGFHPDPWQADLLRSRSRKVILNCSRQSGKSSTCAALGLHESIYRRPSFGLVVAPTQDQSSELMLKFDEFRGAVELPSDYLSTDTKLAVRFANGNRFIARPGSEKSARSFSAVTLLLEDEASRVLDDLYNSVRPMLAVSNGRHILMSTPFGKRGHFFKIWSEERDLWEWYEITAEMCPRISKEFLEVERRTNLWYLQEYFCVFMETVDSVFTFDQIAAAVSDEVEPLFGVDQY